MKHNLVRTQSENGSDSNSVGLRQPTSDRFALERLLGEDPGSIFESVLESLVEGVSCCDRDGYVVYANSAMERIVGLPREQMRAKRMYEFLYPPESEQYRTAVELQHARYKARLMGISEEYEIERVNARGGAQWLVVRASPLRNGSGEIVGSVGVVADHTGKPLLQSQLLWSQKMDAVGRLAQNVAHDFNNLLTVILGHCERLLQQIPLDDPTHRRLNSIHQASKAAAALTQQLLTVSKRKAVQPQAQDINALIRDTQAILRDFVTEGIRIEMNLHKNLPLVMADSGQIQQVLINLAINARDAMPSGGVLTFTTAKLSLAGERRELPSCNYVSVAVTDTGAGMSDEVLEHLFEPFYTTKKDGTGLGLAITHAIVEQNAGRMCVSSSAGEGSTFTVLLPELETSAACSSIGAQPREIDSVQGEFKLLVVEDEAAVRDLISGILEDHGFVVVCAADGAAAVAILERSSETFSLVLSDVAMPNVNGLQLSELVQQRFPNLPFVLMSGRTNDSALPEQVVDRGIPFITKPFALDSLLTLIRAQLAAGTPSVPSN